MSSLQSSSQRSVTAFFDSRADAEAAAERIRAEGVSDSDIRIVAGDGDTADAEVRTEKKGFWESLSDFFLPNEDRYAYAEGLSRGGYLVSVGTSEANRSRVLDILDDEGTVDMDAREASWREEGWSGYEAGRDSDIGTESFGRPASAAGGGLSDAVAAGRDAAPTGVAGADRGAAFRRDTAEGRARVRSYFSEGTLGGPSVVDQAQPVDDQVRRTEVELDDERRESADDITRRTRGAI